MDLELKPCINKKNGQINVSIPRKKLPSDVKKALDKDPSLIKVFKMKYRGFR